MPASRIETVESVIPAYIERTVERTVPAVDEEGLASDQFIEERVVEETSETVEVQVERPTAEAENALGSCTTCRQPVYLGQHVPDDDPRRSRAGALHARCLI
jgi:hypothetical protein